jgi:hypothetical protein
VSAVLDAPPARRMRVDGDERRATVWQLAAVEGRRVVRNPFFLLGCAFGVTLAALVTDHYAPVLHYDDMLSPLWVMPAAGACLVLANAAALRARRTGAEELFDSLAATRVHRTFAVLLAAAWPVVVSVLLLAGIFGWYMVRGPVGTPGASELLTGPVVVALAIAIGVAVAEWWPATIGGPIAFVLLGTLELFLSVARKADCTVPNESRWLAFWVPPSSCGQPPRELLIRAAGAHLVWLLALLVLIGAVAVGRNVIRSGSRGGRRLLATVVGASLTVTIVAGIAQQRSPSPAERASLAARALTPDRFESCRVRDAVRYCSFPAYLGWVDRWASAVDPVVREALPGVLRGLTVRQVLGPPYGTDLPARVGIRLAEHPPFPERPGIFVGDIWGDGTDVGRYQLALALQAATIAVGLPTEPSRVRLSAEDIRRLVADQSHDASTKPGSVSPVGCTALGQARGVVAIWLAASVSPAAGDALRRFNAESPYGIVAEPHGTYSYLGSEQSYLNDFGDFLMTGLVRWGKAEAVYARQLLSMDAARVAATLRAHWVELTDPSTPTSAVVRLFGLRRLPTIAEQARRLGLDPARVTPDTDEAASFVPCRTRWSAPGT